MNLSEVIDNNKMIADFMGKEMYQYYHDSYYHNSWDWLMPVVEKIKTTICYDRGDIFNVQFIISNHKVEFYEGGYTKKESYWYNGDSIESVYNAVVGCIKMINNRYK
jgi:hypothetical protein